ncbi:hypothetical protein MMC06_001935 [Schaereria dolodes]|nr:hypothetical protein [Schaereria dolodes]
MSTVELTPAQLQVLCAQYRGTAPLVLAWTLGSTATVIVALRFYVKRYLKHTVGWDDYMAIAALLISIVDNAAFTKMFYAGIGRHAICVGEAAVYDTIKWSTIAQIIETVALMLVKLSVCLLLLRVIEKTSRRMTQFLYVLMVFIVALHIVPFFLYVLQCRPLRAVWDPLVQGKCYSLHLVYRAAYVAIGLDAFTDLVCSAIPIFVIYKLQMDIRTKIAICILMGLGVFTAACAIVKATTLNGVFSVDYTWAIYTPSIWSVVETQLSMNIASISTLRPLFSHIMEMSSRRSSHASSEKHHDPHSLHKATSEQHILARRINSGGKISASFSTDPDVEFGYHEALAHP